MLAKTDAVVISEVAKVFGTSEMTIRRDLDDLEQRGVCQRTHGGAISLRFLRYEDSRYGQYLERTRVQIAEKAAIGRAAARLVQPGELIAIDSGSTAAYLALALRNHTDLTVLTNSYRVVDQLVGAEGVTVISPGGTVSIEGNPYEGGETAVMGPVTTATLRTFRPSKVFISASAVSISDGISNQGLHQAEVKRVLIEIGEEVFLIVDHTKFAHPRGVIVAEIGAFRKVITDTGTSPTHIEQLTARNIDVIAVEPDPDPPPLRVYCLT
jgi:DeoR family transcriptional regulator, fructose operon transcriptional repressor